ncbi:tyrosine-type recombinase/integrase [Cryptosporangium sp. NPDC051539]|uniref:tyrosine-type recombinase/integrase n=1 Tax=Cryptosporangium sp. NPDC051539 TaxID=3363962 RepID=UPI0037B9B457
MTGEPVDPLGVGMPRSGRPPLEIGTSGKHHWLADGKGWQARCRYRDYDGKTRLVARWGPTKGAASNALNKALRDRLKVTTGSEKLTAETRVHVLAEMHYTRLKEDGRAINTLQNYRGRLDGNILPAAGELRIRELTPGYVDNLLRTIKRQNGAATAKTCRSILSGMSKIAVTHGALTVNPVRDVAPISTKPKKKPRALKVAEVRQLRAFLTYDHKAVLRDLIDFVDIIIATGARIGEASAITWDCVDLIEGTVEIRGTVIRVKQRGLEIQPYPKSEHGDRVLILPRWAIAVLTRRHATTVDPTDVVFPAPHGGLRDPSNTQADLKEAFTTAGFDWVTSHIAGRKTVATTMEKSGLGAVAAADQLGQSNPSMTYNVYMGRGARDTGAADALEQMDFG